MLTAKGIALQGSRVLRPAARSRFPSTHLRVLAARLRMVIWIRGAGHRAADRRVFHFKPRVFFDVLSRVLAVRDGAVQA